MNEDRTFWECVYDARYDRLFPCVWRTEELIEPLTYGRDFTMEPGPRWAVKQVRPEDDRYPLKGRSFRSDHRCHNQGV